ncbi:hypothetical protein K6V92_01140 [Cupriavidus respiraculi]|uniref:hypothetical protein n=1 Tax=Cupriavidus respiraculi TaxID=195930 RepID=UPI001C93B6AD|nr:hypothetical protein [Cupriavidus respiraculi]MBY4945232.1 hypothetical protein [Cupriavidus respiraculi]
MGDVVKRLAEGKVFNLSLGRVISSAVKFSWISPELSDQCGRTIEFNAEIINNPDLFEGERQLALFHSIGNKQTLGYNPRAAAQTAILRVSYDDFPPDSTYAFVERGNIFLSEAASPILSFFQRRRVVFSTIRFTSSKKLIYAMPPFLAGEWIDSVAYGPELIDCAALGENLTQALSTYAAAPRPVQARVRMLLQRYNELLNLPYVHERVEGLWRVLEALGGDITASSASTAEYERLLKVCKAHKSTNLELLLRTLTHYTIAYTDDEVVSSRRFRNHATHEYLDPQLMTWESLPSIFNFLHHCVDIAIASELGVPRSAIKPATFSTIQNRVV